MKEYKFRIIHGEAKPGRRAEISPDKETVRAFMEEDSIDAYMDLLIKQYGEKYKDERVVIYLDLEDGRAKTRSRNDPRYRSARHKKQEMEKQQTDGEIKFPEAGDEIITLEEMRDAWCNLRKNINTLSKFLQQFSKQNTK